MNSLLTKNLIRCEAMMVMHHLTGRDWREFDHGALSVEMDPVSWWNDAWENQPPDMKLTFWLDGRHVSCEITKSTLLMSIEEFAQRIITPMCKQLTPWSDDMGLWAQFCEAA